MIKESTLIKTENESLIRDIHSKALLNDNYSALVEYKQRKNILIKNKAEQLETKERLAQLESDMQDIKRLLIEIAELRK
jgi:hypothetical protein